MMNQVNDEKVEAIANHYRAILALIGEDVEREGLKKTPERAAKAILYATNGYCKTAKDVVKDALFEAPGSGIVAVKDIEFYSLCEHHILPFFGHVTIAYIPNKKILGISKLARLVDMYARRLQIQERFTEQLADALSSILKCDDVAVICNAHHMCMKMRGVEKQDSTTTTMTLRGAFAKDNSLLQRI